MKTSIAVLSVVMMLAAAGASAQLFLGGDSTNRTATQIKATVDALDAQYVSGTEYAAIRATRDLIAMINNIPAKQIAVEVIQVQGNSIAVKATMPARECDLSLIKNVNANKYGWLVQTHLCREL